MADIVGSEWAGWIDLIRNLALICLAPTLFFAARYIEKKSATHNLIQRLTVPAPLENLERVRLRRLFKEGASSFDPYAPDQNGTISHDLLFDLVIILNFYEGICGEIWEEWVKEKLVYEQAASIIVGARDVHLKILTDLTDHDPVKAYPKIYAVANRCTEWAKKREQSIFSRIISKPPPSKNSEEADQT